jgi:DNA-binding transcriptional regulator GbsR (MarR family)
MSKPEIERLGILETKVDDIKDDLIEIKKFMKDLPATLDQRYANKAVEEDVKKFKNVLLYLMGAIVLGILYIILNHVGIPIKF